MTHLENLVEDFKGCFDDLEKMKVTQRILTPFDIKIKNADIHSQLENKFIDMTVDLESMCLVLNERTP